MGPALAREVLTQLEPKIAIPMTSRDGAYLMRSYRGLKTQIAKTESLTIGKETYRFSGGQSFAAS